MLAKLMQYSTRYCAILVTGFKLEGTEKDAAKIRLRVKLPFKEQFSAATTNLCTE